MSTGARRMLLVAGAVLATYYLVVFAYVLRSRALAAIHLKWEVPLKDALDWYPDPMDDGIVCAGNTEALIWVGPDGALLASQPVEFGVNATWWQSCGRTTLVLAQQYGQSGVGGQMLTGYDAKGVRKWSVEGDGSDSFAEFDVGLSGIAVSYQSGKVEFRRHDGELSWQSKLDTPPATIEVGPKGELFVLDTKGRIVKFDKVGAAKTITGENKQLASASAMLVASEDGRLMVFDYQHLLVVDSQGSLLKYVIPATGVSPNSQGLLDYWLGSGYYPSTDGPGPPSFGPDGSMYIAPRGDTLFALDCKAKVRWTRRQRGMLLGAVATSDGKVIAVWDIGGVCAYDGDGKLLWRNARSSAWKSAPALGSSGLVYIEARDSLCAFEP